MDTTDQISPSTNQAITIPWVDFLWFRILLIAALGLGVFFRLAGLGNKMVSHDEAYTSLYAAGYRSGYAYTSLWDGQDKSLQDIQKFLRPNDEKSVRDTYTVLARFEPHESPVFFLIAHYWMQLVGYDPGAMRALAALFSLLSIPALYWLSKELFHSTGTALLATALFALSPYQILYAQDARPYSLWTLATLVSSAALLQAMRKNNRATWLIYALTLILGVYSHQLFILVALAHALYFAGKQTLRSPKIFSGFAAAALVAMTAFAPWMFYIITRWDQAAARLEWTKLQFPWYRYIQKWMLNFSSPLLDFEWSSGKLIAYAFRALLLILVIAAWIYLFRRGSFRQKKFLLLLFLMPAGLFVLSDIFLGGIRSTGGRYFVAASIATILVIAYFLSDGLDRADSRTGSRWKFLITLLVAVEIFSNVNSLYTETWWNKELGRVRPELVHEINKQQTLLIVSGFNPTNLGDILALGFELDYDVHFRLYENPADIQVPDDYQNIYWFPSSFLEVQKVGQREDLQVTEVLPGTLWKVQNKGECLACTDRSNQ